MVLATTNIETPLIMTFLWEFHITPLCHTQHMEHYIRCSIAATATPHCNKTWIELKAPLSDLQFLKWRQQSKKTSACYI